MTQSIEPNDSGPLNRVQPGMHVEDATGQDIGRVDAIRMGDDPFHLYDDVGNGLLHPRVVGHRPRHLGDRSLCLDPLDREIACPLGDADINVGKHRLEPAKYRQDSLENGTFGS